MICTLTIVRYPKWLGWAGFLSMAVFRLPLLFNKKINFWKLLGCGRNGTFDIVPDWRQWGVLRTWNQNITSGAQIPADFLSAWWKFFHCEVWTLLLEPIQGHGTWDGKPCFGDLPKQTSHEAMTGVLTRATIRISKLKHFWKNVSPVADHMSAADGFIHSVGIGEVPWIKQATFSIWETMGHMKQFAYQSHQHTDVIRKTRDENWYSEEMFVRFKILSSSGTLHGKNPLERKS